MQAPAQALPQEQSSSSASVSGLSSATPASSSPLTLTSATGHCHPGARHMLPDSRHDKDRLSMDFPESKALAKQAHSELLDRVVTFCSLERSDTEDQRKVTGMQNPVYHDPATASIKLALPWHSSAVEITDHNFNIVTESYPNV